MYFEWSCICSTVCTSILASLLLVAFFVSGFPYWWLAIIVCLVILIGCLVWPVSRSCFKLRPQASEIDSDASADIREQWREEEREIMDRERMARVPRPLSSKHIGLWADEIDSCCPQFIQQENDKKCELPTCAICLEDIEIGSMKRALQGCGHEFHSECIRTWVVRKASCPLCNMVLKPKEQLACGSEAATIAATYLNVPEETSSHAVIEFGQDQGHIMEIGPVGGNDQRETVLLIASEGSTVNQHASVINLAATVPAVPAVPEIAAQV